MLNPYLLKNRPFETFPHVGEMWPPYNIFSWQADGLVGWWNPLGSVYSSSIIDIINGNNATLTGTLMKSYNKIVGPVRVFNGADDYYDTGFPGVVGTNPWTVVFWFSTSDSVGGGNDNCVISWGESNSGTTGAATNIAVENGVIWNRTYSGRVVSFGSGFNDGNMHQAILTSPNNADLSDQRCWVDGVEYAGSVSGDGAINITTDISVTFGWTTRRFSGDTKFNGSLGPVRMYDREFSELKVEQLYDPATRWELCQPQSPRFIMTVPVAAGAIMNQLQGPNLGADLFNGTLL